MQCLTYLNLPFSVSTVLTSNLYTLQTTTFEFLDQPNYGINWHLAQEIDLDDFQGPSAHSLVLLLHSPQPA